MGYAAALQVVNHIVFGGGVGGGVHADACDEFLLGSFKVEDERFGRGEAVPRDG